MPHRAPGWRIAVLGESGIDDGAYLHLYTVDPARPLSIRDNFSSIAFCVILVQPRKDYETFGSDASVRLWNAVIDLNSAPDGAAIFLGSSSDVINETLGGETFWNMGVRPPSAAPCPEAAPCGRIADNVTSDSNGAPTDGAIVAMQEDAKFGVTQAFEYLPTNNPGIIFEGNLGGRLFDMEGGEDRVDLFLRNSLIVDNTLSQELVRASDEPQVALVDSTIAANNIGAGHGYAVSDDLLVQRAIIWQPAASQVGPQR